MSTLVSTNEPHNQLNARRHFWETYEPSVARLLRKGLHALSKLNTPPLYLFAQHYLCKFCTLPPFADVYTSGFCFFCFFISLPFFLVLEGTTIWTLWHSGRMWASCSSDPAVHLWESRLITVKEGFCCCEVAPPNPRATLHKPSTPTACRRGDFPGSLRRRRGILYCIASCATEVISWLQPNLNDAFTRVQTSFAQWYISGIVCSNKI